MTNFKIEKNEIDFILQKPILTSFFMEDGSLVLSFGSIDLVIPNNDELESFTIDINNESFFARKSVKFLN